MKTLVVSIATLALAAGPATLAYAKTNDAPAPLKPLVNACATSAKPTKVEKAARIQNHCDTDGGRHIGAVPLVFGGAVIAGIVAVAVTNSSKDNATSP